MTPQAPTRWLGGLVLLCGIGGAPQASAQEVGTRPDFAAAAQRAEREGSRVFKWILLHGDKPAKPRDEAKPAAPAAKPAAKPVARTNPAATAGPAKDPAAPSRAATSAAASPPQAPASTHAVAAAASQAPADAAAALPVAGAAVAASTAASTPPAAAVARQVAAVPAAPPDEPDEDQPLVLLRQVEPDYPLVVIRRIKQGWVQLQFEVQPGGSVASIEVVDSSNPRLNPAAIDALAQWKFQPLRRAQTGMVKLEFDFR